jgi:hypothetical protein
MQLPPLAIIESWPAPNYVDPVTRGRANAVMNFVLYPLVCVALGIRVYTRLRISRSFGWDDWLILLSFVCLPLFDLKRLLIDVTVSNNSLHGHVSTFRIQVRLE